MTRNYDHGYLSIRDNGRAITKEIAQLYRDKTVTIPPLPDNINPHIKQHLDDFLKALQPYYQETMVQHNSGMPVTELQSDIVGLVNFTNGFYNDL
jgi:hypothetical protein